MKPPVPLRGPAAALVASLLMVGPAACRRLPELRKGGRPHEVLVQADSLYRQGRLAEAEDVYTAALAKAQRADLGQVLMVYADRRVQISAQQRHIEDADRHFRYLESLRERPWWTHGMLRSANNLAVLRYERGELDEAERLLTQALETEEDGTVPGMDKAPQQILAWVHLDRVRSARHRPDEAAAALREAHMLLGGTLPARLRTVLDRHVSFLRTSGRVSEAEAIDERLRVLRWQHTDPCVIDRVEAPMGCHLEIGGPPSPLRAVR